MPDIRVDKPELVVRILATIDKVMRRHSLFVGEMGAFGAPRLSLYDTERYRLSLNDDFASVEGAKGRLSTFRNQSVTLSRGLTEKTLDAFLRHVEGLTCAVPGINVPYGWVERGKVVAIYCRHELQGTCFFLPEGAESMPIERFFQSLEPDKTDCAWFMKGLKAKRWVHLQKRLQGSCQWDQDGLTIKDSERPLLAEHYRRWGVVSRKPEACRVRDSRKWHKLVLPYA